MAYRKNRLRWIWKVEGRARNGGSGRGASEVRRKVKWERLNVRSRELEGAKLMPCSVKEFSIYDILIRIEEEKMKFF